MHPDRLNIGMVVGGFPTYDDPCSGVFSLRAAQALSSVANVNVVHLRAWIPGRPLSRNSTIDGIPVTVLTAPQLPTTTPLNVLAFTQFAWKRASVLLSNCNLIHSVGADRAGVVSSHWARRLRIHHVTQVIGSDMNTLLPRLGNRRGVKGWERCLHGVACSSDDLAQRFRKMYPNVKNVRTIRNGVDLEIFQRTGPVAGPFERANGARFLYLGGFPDRNSDLKGGRVLLEAWRSGESELVKAGACLIVAGPDSDVSLVQEWRSKLRSPCHVCLAGRLAPRSIPAYMRGSDAVVIPSLREGLPNVAMEAAACGRAVFASSVGGLPEVVVDGKTGILLPPADVNAWRAALLFYASRLPELQSMGQVARVEMELRFDSRRYPEQLLHLYEAALTGETVIA